jgi:thioesterase domain-containing protein/acyl carrier protein
MHATILARMAQDRNTVTECSLRFIRSCSASLPPQLMAELEKAFSVPVVEAYGMTEASHQMAINPLPPSERKPGSVGLPTGTEIRIVSETGHLLACNETGSIVIRGENVTPGYMGVSGGGYTDVHVNDAQVEKWFATGDQGYIDSDGYLYVTGRTKEIINRGGEKISPREVEEVLISHPAVAEVVVFAVADVRLGEDVGAAIVLNDRVSASEDELRQFAAERLSYFKLPRRLVFLNDIPKGPTGKPQRIGLAERLGLNTIQPAVEVNTEEVISPRTPIETVLTTMWQQALKLDRISVDADFFDLGGDSFSALQLVLDIQKIIGVELSTGALFEAPTIEKLARLALEGGVAERQPAVVPIQPNGSRRPFFCVHAGPLFRSLADHLGQEQPFLGLAASEIPKLADPVRLEDIAQRHLKTILAVQPEGPYYIGGWCVDGLVAYEIAQQLQRQGQEVGLLVLFDTENPRRRGDVRSHNVASARAARVRKKVNAVFSDLRRAEMSKITSIIIDHVYTMKAHAWRKVWQLYYGFSTRAGIRVFDKLRDAEEILYFAVKHYIPQPYNGRVLLLQRNLGAKAPHLENGFGWTDLVYPELNLEELCGDHRDMFLEPYVQETAGKIIAYWDTEGAALAGAFVPQI